jgi:shikimate kinase
MGVGKTTIGAGLAARLGRPLRDSDRDLEAAQNIRGRELARRDGVEALHRWEAEHLLGALDGEEPVVIAAAASVVDDAACREALVDAFVVWLRAPARTLVTRMQPSDHRRSVVAGGTAGSGTGAGAALEALEALEARRNPLFREVADASVDAGGSAPDQVTLAIVDILPPGLRLIGSDPADQGGGPKEAGWVVPDDVRSPGRTPGP